MHITPPQSGETDLTAPPDMTAEPEPPPWGWLDVGKVLLLTLAGIGILFPLMQLITSFSGSTPQAGIASPVVFVAVAVIYLLLILGVYLFAARKAGWAALGWRPASWLAIAVTPGLLVVELMGMAMINSGIALLQGGTFENPQTEAITGGQALDLVPLLLLLLLIAGLVPVAEELFFRGMIYPLLRARWGLMAAVVGSAAIFAVFHFILLLVPALFFVGLILGLLREWSKSVVPGIVLHGLQNGVALLAINAVLSGAV